ncbi:MAG: GTPase domain-containing protein [Micrococcales bacterium]|nr:GTPase domain-containing protein [Micrococcales bacterium]
MSTRVITMGIEQGSDGRLDRARALREDLTRHAATLAGPWTTEVSDAAASLSDALEIGVFSREGETATAPVLVIVGPSGVGKSVLVNTLAGEVVSPVGALRPTTRRPVLLTATTAPKAVAPLLTGTELHRTEAAPKDLVIADMPDRRLVGKRTALRTAKIEENADAVILLTSATRYGDEAVWYQVKALAARAAPWGVIVTRAAADDLEIVSEDLADRLAQAGHDDVPILAFRESPGPIDHLGDIEEDALREWLSELIPDASKLTTKAALRGDEAVAEALVLLGGALARQAATAKHLTGAVEAAWRDISESGILDAPQIDPEVTQEVTRLWAAGDYEELAIPVEQGMNQLLAQARQLALDRVRASWGAAGASGAEVRALVGAIVAAAEGTPTPDPHFASWLRDLGDAAATVEGAPSSLVEAVKAATLGCAKARGRVKKEAGSAAERLLGRAEEAHKAAVLAAAREVVDAARAALDQLTAADAVEAFEAHAAAYAGSKE